MSIIGVLGQGSSWEEMCSSAESALSDLQSRFIEEFRRGGDHNQWGQFLNPPPQREHTGIYGTASGILVSALPEHGDYHAEIEQAQQWLIDQWESDDSETAESGYKSIVYKFVFCLLALSEEEETIFGTGHHHDRDPEIIEEFYEDLWERANDSGWGEFWFESERTETQNASTALALLALADHPPVREQGAYTDYLVSLSERVVANSARSNSTSREGENYDALSLAFTLLALCRYRDLVGKPRVESVIPEKINDTAKSLESHLSRQRKIDLQTYHVNLISLPDSEEALPIEREHYIIFPVFPIIATALLQAGDDFAARNKTTLLEIFESYTGEIRQSNNSCFASENTNRCSTFDHLWISLAFQSFIDANPQDASRFSKLRGWVTQKTIATGGILLLTITGFLVGAYLNQNMTGTVPTVVSWALFIICGSILRGLHPVQAVGDKVGEFIQRLS